MYESSNRGCLSFISGVPRDGPILPKEIAPTRIAARSHGNSKFAADASHIVPATVAPPGRVSKESVARRLLSFCLAAPHRNPWVRALCHLDVIPAITGVSWQISRPLKPRPGLDPGQPAHPGA
jgi:hypothetical protein